VSNRRHVSGHFRSFEDGEGRGLQQRVPPVLLMNPKFKMF
jgi:hypothetical protein